MYVLCALCAYFTPMTFIISLVFDYVQLPYNRINTLSNQLCVNYLDNVVKSLLS